MYACETGIVRSHTIVLKAGDGLHTLLRHILLCEHDGQLLGAVVAIVKEDYHIAFLDGTVNGAIIDRLDELICHTLVIAFLHSLHHIGGLLALGTNQQIVCNLHTLPALITVHRIETTDDAGNSSITCLVALSRNLFDKALTALGVGITTVHKAVNKGILNLIFLTNLNQFEQMIQ